MARANPLAAEIGEVDFPTLFVAHDWAEAHCVIPDGIHAGDPWLFHDWQSWCLLNFYRVKPSAKAGQLAPAFYYRRSQIVGPQKLGKAPYTSAHVCVEGVGPALFAGWAEGGETWDCRDHGCGCGWVYEYEPGEAMGRRWPTPLVQITAFSEDQTDNIYDALRPMIELGPLVDVVTRVGEEFIRLPNRGRIDIVTSKAQSRLGQRVTFVPQDETGIWTSATKMIRVAETQRRGLAGMGGRAEETTNGWDPNEQSVAQRTAEANMPDVFRFHPLADPELDYRAEADRRKIHEHVYLGSSHVDLDAIEAEAKELLLTDLHQAMRFFGNLCPAGEDKAFDVERFALQARPDVTIEPGRDVVLGFDGARTFDSTGIVVTEVGSGFQTVAGLWERPQNIGDDEWEVPVSEVSEVIAHCFETWNVLRLYGDPPYWQTQMDEWAGDYGADKVIQWWTNRRKATAYAVRAWVTDWSTEEAPLTHDGHDALIRHVSNAVKHKTNMRDEDGDTLWFPTKEQRDSPMKIDLVYAAVLSWAARGDVIEGGALNQTDYDRGSW